MLEKINIFQKTTDWICNKIELYCRGVVYGKRLQIKGRLLLQGRGKIEIGDDVTIYSRYTVNPIGGNRTVFQVMGEANLKIGNRVGMSHVIIAAHNRVEIEDDVLLGAGCKIFDTDFHPLDYLSRIQGDDKAVKTAPVCIKKGAFVGADALILKGVTIGEQSVIGAGAVVTGNVPDGEVWAGNPARCVRKKKTRTEALI